MTARLETNRLLLRESIPDDAEAFFALNNDPRVAEFTGEEPPASVDVMRDMITNYPDYARHGFGRWTVVHKADNQVIGFNGLKHLDEFGVVDIGFRFSFDYWGRGLATESSVAVVNYGFETIGLETIVGLVLSGNARSKRVLTKLGMRYAREVHYRGLNGEWWSVDRDA